MKLRPARRTRGAAEFLSPLEVATYCNVSRSTVFEWLRQGRVTRGGHGLWPIYQVTARTIRIRRDTVNKFMENYRVA
jgi:hypothetical protein